MNIQKGSMTMVATLLCITAFGQSRNTQGTVWKPSLESFTKIERKITHELDSLSSPAAKLHPEYGVLPTDAPCTDCVELIDARTENTRYYVVNGSHGNRFFETTSAGAIHAKNKAGQWITIDDDIIQIDSAIYAPKNIGIQARINTIAAYTDFENGAFLCNHFRLVHDKGDGAYVDYGYASWSNYTAGDDGIHVIDAWPGIDIDIVATRVGFKSDILIKEKLSWLTDGKLMLIDDLYFNEPRIMYSDQGKYSDEEVDGALYSVGSTDTIKFGRAYAKDASWKVDYSTYPFRTAHIAYMYDSVQQDLAMSLSSDWLNDTSRVYPVTIDPLITHSNTFGMGLIRFRFNGQYCGGLYGCSAMLSVNRPSNAEVVAATLAFNYETTYGTCDTTCVMADAGIRMIISTCLDTLPDPTTFYSCNGPDAYTTGICVIDSIDLMPSLSCVPDACTGTIILTCYNSYCGCDDYGLCFTGGYPCNNILNNTWVASLESRTIETLGDSTDGSGTLTLDTTCCVPLILDPLAEHGIEPYTYTWPDGSTTPTWEIDICEDTTLIYTATVKDFCNVTRTATFQITVDDCETVLPITLTNFDAVWEGDHVVVRWETETEVENAAYVLLRSGDGREYETIYTAQGAGTSITTHGYEFHDWNFWPSTNYYKLASVDESGVAVDEAIDIVVAPGKLRTQLYPNPATNTITISLSDEWVVNALVINSLGETVGSVSLQNAETEVDVNGLPKGLYFVRLMNVQSEEILSFIKI